jgi:hypothetical protein
MKQPDAKRLQQIYAIVFGNVYPYYVKKAEKKGRTKAEVDEIICWLTGYTQKELDLQIEKRIDYKTFLDQAPHMNPERSKITGVICGVRVEEVKDKTYQEMRYIDKLIDELAKGKAMEKILRK